MPNPSPTFRERVEELAKKLHGWYLDACQKPESGMDFNPAAQWVYEDLKETQKFLDRYIAEKTISFFDSEWARRENLLREKVAKLFAQRLEDLEIEYFEKEDEHTTTRMYEAKLLNDNVLTLLLPSKDDLSKEI